MEDTLQSYEDAFLHTTRCTGLLIEDLRAVRGI
jgi:hypothetical protein